MEIKCPICNKIFNSFNCRIKTGRKYCSKKCGYIGRGQTNTGRTHFKKGQIPWNKNKKGYMVANKTSFRKGNIPWNKGIGMNDDDRKLRWTDKYKLWRKAVFERDNYTCCICHKIGDIQSHHIKSWSLYPELRFDINNGITLCKECHKKTDNYGRLTKKQKQESMVLQMVSNIR